jgi:hypothetical protein
VSEPVGYVKATISDQQEGPHSGKEVEVLADDYTVKGDEEMVEVKIGDDVVFIEKKYIVLDNSAMEKPDSELSTEPKTELLDEEDEDENFSLDLPADIEDEEEPILDEPSEEPSEDGEGVLASDDDITIGDLGLDDVTSIGAEGVEKEQNDPEVLRAKLLKSLQELEDIKSNMTNTFTSTDTISSTIQSLRGMIDALKKDQMNILSRK